MTIPMEVDHGTVLTMRRRNRIIRSGYPDLSQLRWRGVKQCPEETGRSKCIHSISVRQRGRVEILKIDYWPVGRRLLLIPQFRYGCVNDGYGFGNPHFLLAAIQGYPLANVVPYK